MGWRINRISQGVISFIAAISFSFIMIRLIPGGPEDYLRANLALSGGSSTIAELATDYMIISTDAPIWRQYINYVVSVFQGDLGRSVSYQQPAADLVFGALPWTLFYMTISLFLMYVIAILGGAYIAYRAGSRTDSVVSIISIILNSTPYYVFGLLLLFIAGYQYSLFPTGGRTSIEVEAGLNLPFVIDLFSHITLPVLSMVITGYGLNLLLMRGNSISVLGEDYVRVAELRGLSGSRISWRYVGRNAILPMYTQIILSIGYLFGGSIILETIFNYQGIGYYMFEAITARDYPLMMACFIVITAAVVIGIVFADLTYSKLDPQIGSNG